MILILLICCFAFLILFPGTAFDGAQNGLLLWFEIVLPTLFPFLVITNLMETLLPITSGRIYAIFTGFLSGYPIGAKSCNYVVSTGKTSKKEGQFLLSFCNNASPAFLLNYCFIRCLNVGTNRFLLLFILYLSAFLSALIICPKKKKDTSLYTTSITRDVPSPSFDTILMKSFEIITKIGGYIILFSLFANIIKVHLPIAQLYKTLLCGIFELTTGMNLLLSSTLSRQTVLLIGMFIASFGGLSALFQTKSVLKDSGLSIKTYGLLKLCSGFISLIATKLLFLLNIL